MKNNKDRLLQAFKTVTPDTASMLPMVKKDVEAYTKQIREKLQELPPEKRTIVEFVILHHILNELLDCKDAINAIGEKPELPIPALPAGENFKLFFRCLCKSVRRFFNQTKRTLST